MANTFAIPKASNTIAIARGNWNDSLDALLTTFYGTVAPDTSNFDILGDTPSIVPDGILFRSSSLGTLFIKDDLNQQDNPFYTSNNFTRNGIGYILEENIVALSANIINRERGEIIVTPSPNTRIYVKSTFVGSNFVDIGNPAPGSIITSMFVDNAVTADKVGPNVAVLTQAQIFSGQQTILRDGQIDIANAALISTAETGNVIIGLNANSDSKAGITHIRDSNGIQVVGSDGISLSQLNAADALINGVSISSAIGGLKSVQLFENNGTWIKPISINKVIIICVGGGGGGGSSSESPDLNGGGGGAGGYSWTFLDVTAISNANVIVGLGGAGGIPPNGFGIDGSFSNVDSFISCTGGIGGQNSITGGQGGAGGVGSLGHFNVEGGNGNSRGWGGGSNLLGFGGERKRQYALGGTGRLYGGGGGGSTSGWGSFNGTPLDGGIGANGVVIFMEYD